MLESRAIGEMMYDFPAGSLLGRTETGWFIEITAGADAGLRLQRDGDMVDALFEILVDWQDHIGGQNRRRVYSTESQNYRG